MGKRTCPATTLDSGESTTCTSAAYTVTQTDVDAGWVRNVATATGTPPLSLLKQVEDASGDGLAQVGEKLAYTFVVTNTGSVSLTGLTVDDPMLAKAGIAIDCPVTSLAPGEQTTCTSGAYTVTEADQAAGAIPNTASATGTGPNGEQPTASGETTIQVEQPRVTPPSTGSTAPPTTAAPAGPGPASSPSAPPRSTPKIAYTGVDVAPMASLAGLLLLTGAAAAYAGRRRKHG